MLSIPLWISPSSDRPMPLGLLPLTGGVPVPKGALGEPVDLRLRDETGRLYPVAALATERWADGSVRWLLIDALVDTSGWSGSRPVWLEVGAGGRPPAWPAMCTEEDGTRLRIDTGSAVFSLGASPGCGVLAGQANGEPILAATDVVIVDGAGRSLPVTWAAPVAIAQTSLRTQAALRGTAVTPEGRRLELHLRLECYAGLSASRLRLTVRNPHRANHPGGIWELGDSGSLLLKELSLVLQPRSEASSELQVSLEEDRFTRAHGVVDLYQASSGGDNWNSTNHITRSGALACDARGYSVLIDDATQRGSRATPSVLVGSGSTALGVALPKFWQNFPRGLHATPQAIRVSFFPSSTAEPHELQGGEQKTHECYLLLGNDLSSVTQPLSWCHHRPMLYATPAWHAQAGAVRHLVAAPQDDAEYRRLVDAALDGPHSFFRKRETADEYGWRHFGDIYGDHEAVRHTGPTPLMSHYNNQYDPIAGFLYQFARTGDPRWWTQCQELTEHVVDIDIYHTNEDKAAYNQGLFWHTIHYVDAGKSTHRTYPSGTHGGGPSSEQNYTTGLMLHHFVTGDFDSREAALGLAQFVIDMDDGHKTVFRWLDTGYTGIASASKTPDYHGPGRGSGNSLNALLDGHRLSGERRFLDKAEQLIRRVTHPKQNIEQLGLLDPENRWFYTMYLQSLAKYLEYKDELGELDAMYAYGRDVLLHFARWMAAHERPYLDRPDLLEFPTETWPAQDIRKSEVFDAAARHTSGEEQARFLERAELFFAYCTRTLSEMPTRSLARPVVLLMAHGLRRAYARHHGVQPAPLPQSTWTDRWPRPEVFVPQKVRAIRRAKLLAAGIGVVGLLGLGWLAWRLLSI